jgi:hypothetical protein
MLLIRSNTPTSDDLLAVSNAMGQPSGRGRPGRAGGPGSQVAAALIHADGQGGGAFADPLKSAFVRRVNAGLSRLAALYSSGRKASSTACPSS